MTETEQQIANLQAVRASARLNALDRYYAALFAPAAVRDDLIALAAFSGEIARIGRQVSEPAVGEIRIAWWRDALLAAEHGAASGNPVLDVFAAVVKRHALSSERIEDFLSAHAEALYADAPADDRALNRRLRAIDGTPLALAAQILGVAVDERANEVLDAAARAAGMARIGLELPYALMHGRSPLPVARSPNPFEISCGLASANRVARGGSGRSDGRCASTSRGEAAGFYHGISATCPCRALFSRFADASARADSRSGRDCAARPSMAHRTRALDGTPLTAKAKRADDIWLAKGAAGNRGRDAVHAGFGERRYFCARPRSRCSDDRVAGRKSLPFFHRPERYRSAPRNVSRARANRTIEPGSLRRARPAKPASVRLGGNDVPQDVLDRQSLQMRRL